MNCPSAETLAAFAEGGLDAASREAVLAHLPDCDDCRRVATILAAKAATTRRAAPPRRSATWWMPAAAAVLVAGAAIWLLRTAPEGTTSPTPVVKREDPPQVPKPPAPSPSMEPSVDPTPAPPPPPPPAPTPTPDPPAPPPPVPTAEPTSTPAPPPPPSPTPTPSTAPPPAPTTTPAPRRELAAVRLLDVTGDLQHAKKRVTEGQIVKGPVTAPTGAAFRVGGDLVFLGRGATATVGLDGTTPAIRIDAGEAVIESAGTTWILGDRELKVDGRAFAGPSAAALSADLGERESVRRFAPYRPFIPRQKTLVFDDFSGRDGGILKGAHRGPDFAARLALEKPVPYSRKLFVRFRYRASERTLLVAMFPSAPPPWVGMTQTKKGWQEAILQVSRFTVDGPMPTSEPKPGDLLGTVEFGIPPPDSPQDAPFLEIDDLVIFEKE